MTTKNCRTCDHSECAAPERRSAERQEVHVERPTLQSRMSRIKRIAASPRPKGAARAALIAGLVIAASCTRFALAGDGKEVVGFHFIDVGFGDATLVRLPGGKDILIDTGRLSAASRLRRYLEEQGVEALDRLILTHPHPDHIGGTFELLDSFPTAATFDNGARNPDSDIFDEYLDLLDQRRIPHRVLEGGESFAYGRVVFTVLRAPDHGDQDLNASSLVVRIQHGEVSVLIAADLNAGAEARMLRSGVDLRSQVLRVGHHGAADATSEPFLRAVSPEIAIVSVGPQSYGYPSKDLMERLDGDPEIRLLRTDRDGTIVVETDGKALRVSTERRP